MTNVANVGPALDLIYKGRAREFPGGPEVKNPPSNAGDKGSFLGWGSKIPILHRGRSFCFCVARTLKAPYSGGETA